MRSEVKWYHGECGQGGRGVRKVFLKLVLSYCGAHFVDVTLATLFFESSLSVYCQGQLPHRQARIQVIFN